MKLNYMHFSWPTELTNWVNKQSAPVDIVGVTKDDLGYTVFYWE